VFYLSQPSVVTITIHNYDDELVYSAQQVLVLLLVLPFYRHVRSERFEESPHFGLSHTGTQIAESLTDCYIPSQCHDKEQAEGGYNHHGGQKQPAK
jgi:hypothetical protein